MIDAKGNITASNSVANDSLQAIFLAKDYSNQTISKDKLHKEYSKARDWINRTGDINKPDEFNRYPIHFVLSDMYHYWMFDGLPLIQLLVEKGADVNVADVSGNTPLHIAAEMGNEPLVNLLLYHGADAKVKNHIGDTPLHSAGRKRSGISNLPLLKRLLSKGVKIDQLNNRGESAIVISARNGNQGLVHSLIEAVANVDGKDLDGFTLLHFDIDTQLVEILLKKGLDVNVKSNNGQTPLHSSRTKVTSPEKAELLIQHGAEINAKDNKGDTPLISILRFANHNRRIKKVARLLIQSGADVNSGKSESPLFLAVSNAPHKAPFPLVELLLQKGADINKPMTSHGLRTPLHIAKSPDMVRYLLDHGANMYAFDKDGNTPFHRNINWRGVEWIRPFIEKGFDVNLPNQKGKTPLQIAARRKEIVKFLTAQGATLAL
jgi:ankyrin repeat protein